MRNGEVNEHVRGERLRRANAGLQPAHEPPGQRCERVVEPGTRVDGGHDPAVIFAMLRPMTSMTGSKSAVLLNSTTDVPAATTGR